MDGRDVPPCGLCSFFSCVVRGIKGLRYKRENQERVFLQRATFSFLTSVSGPAPPADFTFRKGTVRTAWAQHSALARLRKSVWSFGFCWQSYCEAGWGALKHLPRSCGWPPVLFMGTPFLWSGSRGRWAQQSAGSVCLWCLKTPDRAVIPHRGGLVTQSWTTLRDPMDCSLRVSSVPGVLQARILEWIAMPSSRGAQSRTQLWGSSRPKGQICIFRGSPPWDWPICWVMLFA